MMLKNDVEKSSHYIGMAISKSKLSLHRTSPQN